MPKESADRPDLAGVRVLIVEDQPMVATMAAAVLTERGCTVSGPIGSVEEALAAVADGPPPDVALLNITLDGRSTAPLAAALAERGVPFVIITGEPEVAAPPLRRAPRIRVPFVPKLLVQAVARVARFQR